jgi:predicted transcriptional regulator
MTDDVIYGTRGVLAYDEATDRVQCHACGDWYRMLSGEHLMRHGLTVAAYKERYGLPRTVRLESPSVTTSRRRNRELLAPRHVGPVAGDVLYGERGVLAYDELADRIQCHACGRWYQKLTSFHLKRHGLTIPEYKELYGLNVGMALETPRITELRRRQVEQTGAKERLVPLQKGMQPPGAGHGHRRRTQYRRTYYTPERLQEMKRRRRRWTDDEMLAALRAAQAEAGGILTRYYLDRRGADGPAERCPRSQAVIRRFGSWKRVCELLGQPYRTTPLPLPPGAHQKWSDEAILAALRDLKEQCGGRLTCEALRRHASGYKGRVGAVPSHKTVQAHLGPWRRVCELLDRT